MRCGGREVHAFPRMTCEQAPSAAFVFKSSDNFILPLFGSYLAMSLEALLGIPTSMWTGVTNPPPCVDLVKLFPRSHMNKTAV